MPRLFEDYLQNYHARAVDEAAFAFLLIFMKVLKQEHIDAVRSSSDSLALIIAINHILSLTCLELANLASYLAIGNQTRLQH